MAITVTISINVNPRCRLKLLCAIISLAPVLRIVIFGVPLAQSALDAASRLVRLASHANKHYRRNKHTLNAKRVSIRGIGDGNRWFSYVV